MIRIFGSGADEHIELSMRLGAFTAQAQRRNYQGRALPTELIARRTCLPNGGSVRSEGETILISHISLTMLPPYRGGNMVDEWATISSFRPGIKSS